MRQLVLVAVFQLQSTARRSCDAWLSPPTPTRRIVLVTGMRMRRKKDEEEDRGLWEQELTRYWRERGVTSNTHIYNLLRWASKNRSQRDPAVLDAKLRRISDATDCDPVKLVSRAPSLLSFRPETLEEKMEVYRHYLIGVDLQAMVSRQPTLLQRDVDSAFIWKLKCLVDLLPAANVARMVERQPALLAADPESLRANLAELERILKGSDVARVVEGAPAVLQYDPRTVSQHMEEMQILLPETAILRLLEKAPTLIQCDPESNFGPKIRILRRVVGGRDQEGIDAIISKNPTYLLNSAVKYGRLLFQGSRPCPSDTHRAWFPSGRVRRVRRLSPASRAFPLGHHHSLGKLPGQMRRRRIRSVVRWAEVRRTLRLDKGGPEPWLARIDRREDDYRAWLLARLKVCEEDDPVSAECAEEGPQNQDTSAAAPRRFDDQTPTAVLEKEHGKCLGDVDAALQLKVAAC